MKDLISKDISRCNDTDCLINRFCRRFKQLEIDKENGNDRVPITNFNWATQQDGCSFFIDLFKIKIK